MPCNLKPGDMFPEFQLEDHEGKPFKLSSLTRPSEYDRRLGFEDAYPIILIFYRGFFCPRDQQQMRLLVQFQSELKVNFCKMITISVDEPKVQAAFRAGLSASWKFISDKERSLVKQLDLLDETEGEYAFRALPYTFILEPNLKIHRIYNGWYFVGRPTLEELRQDLREIMSRQSYYSYEAFNSEHVKKIRIPQQEWINGPRKLGESGLPVK